MGWWLDDCRLLVLRVLSLPLLITRPPKKKPKEKAVEDNSPVNQLFVLLCPLPSLFASLGTAPFPCLALSS